MLFVYSCVVTKMMVLVVFVTSQPPNSNNKNITSGNDSSNISILHDNFRCPVERNLSSSIRVCSSKSNLGKNMVGFDMCGSYLSFSMSNISIQICLVQNRLLLPNASITFVSEHSQTYPVYHEKMIGTIKSFFTGSVSIFQNVFPFSGEIHLFEFTGRTFIFGSIFILKCKHRQKRVMTLQPDACYKCQASCVYPDQLKEPLNIHSSFRTSSMITEQAVEQVVDRLRKRQMRRKHRLKRTQNVNNPRKLTCSLHLVSDHLFFEYVGDNDVVKTTNIMLGLVNKVDSIFRNNFNSRTGLDEVGFVVKQVTVYQNKDSHDYKLGGKYMTSDEYLKKFSLYNFSSVCLAVGFTFRNFGGILGTAFPAFSSLRTPGGICNKRMKINSHFVSYNTVIMSFFSSLGQLSDESLALALTHELGHSFGARHDETEECLPGEDIGNYIMSSTVNSGQKPNNFLFSSCSIRSILPVILRKEKCLQSPNVGPVCGNAIPEDGEECDCGESPQCESRDPCCTPADDTSHEPCTIRRHEGKLCSPVVSSCCNSSCSFVSSEDKKICNSLDVCSMAATCDGQREHCPASEPMPRGSPCHNGRNVCEGHSCSGDVCLYRGLTPCKCQNASDTCHLCCRNNESQHCLPASFFGIYFDQMPETDYCKILGWDLNISGFDELHSVEPRSHDFVLDEGIRSWPIATVIVVLILLIMICNSLAQDYKPTISNNLCAFLSGKIIALSSIGEYQSKQYKGKMREINRRYCEDLRKAKHLIHLDYPTAVSRLTILFPLVPKDYISEMVKMCANENMAVRILLTQGAPIKTFSKSIKSLRYAMKKVTIHYKK